MVTPLYWSRHHNIIFYLLDWLRFTLSVIWPLFTPSRVIACRLTAAAITLLIFTHAKYFTLRYFIIIIWCRHDIKPAELPCRHYTLMVILLRHASHYAIITHLHIAADITILYLPPLPLSRSHDVYAIVFDMTPQRLALIRQIHYDMPLCWWWCHFQFHCRATLSLCRHYYDITLIVYRYYATLMPIIYYFATCRCYYAIIDVYASMILLRLHAAIILLFSLFRYFAATWLSPLSTRCRWWALLPTYILRAIA